MRKLCDSSKAARNSSGLLVPTTERIRNIAASSLFLASSSDLKRTLHVSQNGGTIQYFPDLTPGVQYVSPTLTC
jgi:hypothetical protein